MGGSNLVNAPGVYGTLGKSAAGNIPGARQGAYSWTDNNGSLWIFGGGGNNAWNDLWEFNPTTNQWAWMSGSGITTTAPIAVYGELGKPAATNVPGSHSYGMSWTDKSGNLWLFGGMGPLPVAPWWSNMNDLWEFNPTTSQWTWMGGSNDTSVPSNGNIPGVYGKPGVFAAANIPGNRWGSMTWTDSSGNFWLFGGTGTDAIDNDGLGSNIQNNLGDLWEYKPSINQWAWITGSKLSEEPGIYGTQGTFAAENTPGSRATGITWVDGSGNFWLFGGIGYDSIGDQGYLNDLWEFNPTTKEWAWIGGSKTVPCSLCGIAGDYGTLGTAAIGNLPGSRIYETASWIDSGDHLWLFGGYGLDANSERSELNDLWEYLPATNEWAWMGGNKTIGSNDAQPGVYGTLKTPDAGNMPGARKLSSFFTDSSGNFWLFGGNGWDAEGNFGVLNDVWEYQPTFSALTAVVKAGTTANYPVTLPAVMTSPTLTCQNLPTGSVCGYSSGTITITTSPSTPAGTYTITVIFTQTVAGAASGWILMPVLLLPLVFVWRSMTTRGVWITRCLMLVLMAATVLGSGCGGGGGNSGGSGGVGGGGGTQTHQVTNSGVLTLTVQ